MHINSGLFISDSAKSNPWHSPSLPESAQANMKSRWNYGSESYSLNPKLDPLRKFGTSNPSTKPSPSLPQVFHFCSNVHRVIKASVTSSRRSQEAVLHSALSTRAFLVASGCITSLKSEYIPTSVPGIIRYEAHSDIVSNPFQSPPIDHWNISNHASLIHSSYPSPSSSFNHSNPPWKRMDQPPASWSNHWSCSWIPITMSPSKSRPTTLSLR